MACSRYVKRMKNMIRSAVASLIVVAGFAYAGTPSMSVMVSDAGGRAAYKGTTNADGTFANSDLQPGNYVVQLNAKTVPAKGSHYAIVVAAGKKKVAANSVPGEKFTGGGVALRVEVGPGLNVTGQVSNEEAPMSKSGKKMV